MISIFSLSKAFDDYLQTFNDLPAYYVQGETAEPNADEKHLKGFLLNAENFTQFYSAQSPVRQDGLFQIDIRTPKSFGKWENYSLVDLVQSKFQINMILQNNNQKVKVKKISASKLSDDEENFYVTSVSIFYVVFG